MLCQDCPTKDTCKKLCDEAKKYANQDYTGRHESYLPEGDVSEVFENETRKEWPEFPGSKKDLIILMFFRDRYTQTQIVEKTHISKGYVSKVISAAMSRISK